MILLKTMHLQDGGTGKYGEHQLSEFYPVQYTMLNLHLYPCEYLCPALWELKKMSRSVLASQEFHYFSSLLIGPYALSSAGSAGIGMTCLERLLLCQLTNKKRNQYF